jgi:diacylglycerol kinase
MRSLLKSFLYAFRGIGYQLCYERNFRIHCFAALTMLLLASFYDFSHVEWCLLILQICLVIGVESLNTAIEQTDNTITLEPSKHIRRAKDSAAAAVLIFAFGSIFVGYHLFWDVAAFGKIVAFFSVWYRAGFLALYLAAGAILIFCKKTYKQGKDNVD